MATIGRIAKATGVAKRERGEEKEAYYWLSSASKNSSDCFRLPTP